jgi:bifunctional DNA primase/polymerase-like protein
MNFRDRALPLIQRGLFVIPVSPPIPGDRASGKNPLIRDWQNHGTTNRKQIEAWNASWPNANTGPSHGGQISKTN